MILSEQTFIELAGKQEVLDAKIKQKNGVTDLPLRRIELYFRIELAECLNEMKGDFKHWSNKPMRRAEFIEELVDALHFYLSFVNHMIKQDSPFFEDMDLQSAYFDVVTEYDIYQDYISGVKELTAWDIATDCIGSGQINRSLAILLSLAEYYEFTEQDIIDTYNRKNAVNHDRSDSGVY
ncbi:dUTP diphosphatase [Exiguobacterium aestuarii]|uniref:dUTP diphosphatase n=1 Tax=Exiguobacterium aestuarii TaxID=273527 RepID=UPI001CD618FC|nr:dUTP diphosphatase [Exiguobacterium aestuarii]MCA0980224.1 dUTP diphosphatase [Exiguobacterium aestuarii]